MHIFLQEFRYAFRQLYKSPWFTLTVILTLALGIGANTAVFSIMNATLLKGLPVPNPQELVYLHVPGGQPEGAANTGDSETSFSEPVFEDLRQDHRAFADLMAFVPLAEGKVAVRFGDTPEEVEGDMVSGNFFSGLDVSLFWTRRFSRNPSILGQTIYLKGNPFTIAGVGMSATLLVAVGLDGTLAYRVARRTSEIGVRMALRARPSQVSRMLLSENLRVTGIGLAGGLLIALISAGMMQSMLFGLRSRDPLTFIAAFLTVILVSLAASFLPAMPAAAIAPMRALRTE